MLNPLVISTYISGREENLKLEKSIVILLLSFNVFSTVLPPKKMLTSLLSFK